MYDEFYRLTGKPFQLTPDQRFFFDSQIHHRAMTYLRYGIEQGEGFVVITGSIGTGKTMLVRTLLNDLKDRNVVAAQLVSAQVEPEDLLRMVCASFGLDHEGLNKATLLHNLEMIAHTCFAEGKHILLVVDEAHHLPVRSMEELRMLSNFQVAGRSLLQSFLLGQEELSSTLESPDMDQLRQRIVASCHLRPLTDEETKAYVEHRLKLVDWNGDPSLEDGLLAGIFDLTDGVPRRINTLCDRLFLYGYVEGKHSLGPDDVNLVQKELKHELGQTWQASKEEAARSTQYPEASEPDTGAELDSGEAKTIPQHLAMLEAEVKALRLTVQREHKLLHKLLRRQLDLDADDEIA